MCRFFKGLTAALAVVLAAVLFLGLTVSAHFPNEYKVTSAEPIEMEYTLPVEVKPAVNDEMIEAALSQSQPQNVKSNLMLFNLIPIKEVNVQVVQEKEVIPCGIPFGIKMFTEGVVVVGMADVKTDSGNCNPAKDAGLKTGDVILSIDNCQVNTNEEVSKRILNCQGQKLILCVRRSNVTFTTELTPVKSAADQSYKAGLWVRDSSAGIGTLTFYDADQGTFAGLGHGICDVDTGEILPLLNGEIVTAAISGVTKGVKGTPGELRGYFSDNRAIGNLYANLETGVYGSMLRQPVSNQAVPVAMKQEVKPGEAQVLTTIDGVTPAYYSIEIERVNYKENQPTKNMVIRITDSRLLENTGGIVQGMSGSPIIQNGKLIGAVTHVLVNDPARGYAIFAENMLEVSQSLYQQKAA